jgi:pyridoxine 4-dehydrogenase
MTLAPSLTPLGLGTGRLASLGSGISQSASSLLIQTALDNGIRVIDTADTYGSGDSERTIGGALRGRRREEFFLITKAGFPHVALPAAFSPLNQIGKKLLQVASPKRNFSKKYLIRCVEASLKRLRLEYVDAFLLHAAVAGEPSSETWEALNEIRTRGLSRLTGISTKDAEVLRQGIASGQVSIVETPISSEAKNAVEICHICASNDVTLIANEVLKPRLNLQHRSAQWNAMRARHGASECSTIHLLIAYALAQPAVKSVAIGSTSPTHLVENLRALQYVQQHEGLFKEMKEAFQ